jgi:hypothetical protein
MEEARSKKYTLVAVEILNPPTPASLRFQRPHLLEELFIVSQERSVAGHMRNHC